MSWREDLAQPAHVTASTRLTPFLCPDGSLDYEKHPLLGAADRALCTLSRRKQPHEQTDYKSLFERSKPDSLQLLHGHVRLALAYPSESLIDPYGLPHEVKFFQ